VSTAPPARRPVLLAVDDDPGVGRAVQRDLRRRYGERFQVIGADSGQGALDVLDQLALRDQEVALLLADQRMPGMEGVDFLELAIERTPGAKRVLLTAYADTHAAIKAINDISLDHYLTKPWDPPEEHLYPVLDDLLADWEAAVRAAEQQRGVRVIGHRFSQESHAIRDFLARNLVPYIWLDVERDAEAQVLLTASGCDGFRLPTVVFEDGSVMEVPTTLAVAEKVGLETQASADFYDLVIVGGGPAGLAAAVYGASEGLETVLVEREAPGGQAGQSSRIENYLGFPTGLSGADLTHRANTQAQRLGAEVLTVREVAKVEARGPARVVTMADGTELSAHAVLIASGVSWRKLEVPGADALAGRGVYYGAARSEAVACSDEEVFVVGGANSAGQAAVHLAKFAAEVTILYRGNDLGKSMSRYLIDQIEAIANIRVRLGAQVTEVHGTDSVEAITINGTERAAGSSLFIFIGALPRTEWLDGAVARDERGFVLAGADVRAAAELGGAAAGAPPWPLKREPYLLETSMPGVFVAGDVRHQSLKRVASAVGEGSMSVQFVHQYLGELP
jgi:thioredoxin reductase (NADPH)